jgi:hypothetical protein
MNVAASALVADSQPVQELPQAAGCRDPQPLTTLGESLQRPTTLRMTEYPWFTSDDEQDRLASVLLFAMLRGKKRACAHALA